MIFEKFIIIKNVLNIIKIEKMYFSEVYKVKNTKIQISNFIRFFTDVIKSF